VTRGGLLLALGLAACGPVEAPSEIPAAPSPFDGAPFAAHVVRADVGEGGGFGEDALPWVVTGPPTGGGDAQGSLDVLSLGAGGVVELELGLDVVDGPGADLVVFENAFKGAGLVFSEAGEIALSLDGEEWTTFPCDPTGTVPNGCAGMTPVYATDAASALGDDAGGDAFDLADIGLARARFVRVTDRAPRPLGDDGKAGFDLDAVAVRNAER